MMEYKRLTERKTKACTVCRETRTCPQGICWRETIYNRLQELEDKIEQGTLIAIEDVSKLMLKMWGNPCEYEICGEDAIDVIHKYTDYNWCERNCSNEMDNVLCWEQYIKAKLKEWQE